MRKFVRGQTAQILIYKNNNGYNICYHDIVGRLKQYQMSSVYDYTLVKCQILSISEDCTRYLIEVPDQFNNLPLNHCGKITHHTNLSSFKELIFPNDLNKTYHTLPESGLLEIENEICQEKIETHHVPLKCLVCLEEPHQLTLANLSNNRFICYGCRTKPGNLLIHNIDPNEIITS